jgi:pimeloyl-ACP methyl ester carboxylesterase
VVGHSLGGGAVAWACAHRAMQAKRMVLLAPFFDTNRLTDIWCKLHFIDGHGRQLLREGLELDSGMSLAEFMPETLAAETPQPTLIVHDPRDRITRFQDSAAFARKAPQAELYAAESVGHIGLLADEAIMRRVLAFAMASPCSIYEHASSQ